MHAMPGTRPRVPRPRSRRLATSAESDPPRTDGGLQGQLIRPFLEGLDQLPADELALAGRPRGRGAGVVDQVAPQDLAALVVEFAGAEHPIDVRAQGAPPGVGVTCRVRADAVDVDQEPLADGAAGAAD